MHNKNNSPVILTVTRAISPYIMLFGLYVICHGHYSPGGGFQGGALMAASVLLIRIVNNENVYRKQFHESLALPLAALGVFIYMIIGYIPLFFGGSFLDYSKLPMPGFDIPYIRAYGILGIEIGVGLAVMTVLVSIYDTLMGERHD